MCTRSIEAWILLLIVAIANGALRVAVLIPRIGDYRAHVVSTLILTGLIMIITLAISEWIGIASILDAVVVGLVWVAMTLAFEFLAGHYLFGNSWARLLADYDLRHGRIWVVVLIATMWSPLWAVLRRHG